MLVIQPLPTVIIVLVGFVILLLCDRMSIFALFYVTAELIFHIFAHFGTWTIGTGNYMHLVTCPILVIVFMFWALVVFAHRTNIVRLIKGEENPSGLRKGLFGKKNKQQPQNEETKDI